MGITTSPPVGVAAGLPLKGWIRAWPGEARPAQPGSGSSAWRWPSVRHDGVGAIGAAKSSQFGSRPDPVPVISLAPLPFALATPRVVVAVRRHDTGVGARVLVRGGAIPRPPPAAERCAPFGLLLGGSPPGGLALFAFANQVV